MKDSKGQAALEFLTTYGWAILALTIAIGALASFGILNPGNMLPDRCNFPADFICEDHQLVGEPNFEANMQLRHNFGETIYLEDIICEYPRSGNGTWGGSAGTAWSPKQTITATCTPTGAGSDFLIRGQKDKVHVTIVYKLDQTGYDHYAEGELYADVI